MTDDDYKYIYTKHRVYRLSKDAKGIPIEEFYPGATMPAFLKGAVVYDTPEEREDWHGRLGPLDDDIPF